VDVWDTWRETSKKFVDEDGNPKVQTKTRLVFLLDAQMDDGRPFELAPLYTASLHEKAKLRKDLESWRGRAFTPEELKGFDLEKLIGANCQIQVVHAKVGEKVYANVAAIVPLSKNQPKLSLPPGHVRHKDKKSKASDGQAGEWQATDDDLPF
jgi:hypothetical protein